MPVRKIEHLADAVQAVSLEAAKTHLRATDCSEEDELIAAYISAATATASDRLQRALVPARYRLTVDRFSPALELPMPPVLAVESVRYIDPAGIWQEIDPADYLADAVREPGYLVPAPGRRWPCTQDRINAVEVTYTAGYPDSKLPAPIVQWILLAIGDLYEQRTRSAEKPVVPQNFADGLIDAYRIIVL